jgi:autotransporter passenger strand-loop-strand repeat protein
LAPICNSLYGGAVTRTEFGRAYWTNDGGRQFVYSGGEAVNTLALTGDGDQYVYGDAYYTILSGGGGQYVYSGGLGYEAFIESGGFQVVPAGGTADYSQVT